MKKIIALVATFALCLVLGACSNGTSEGNMESEKQDNQEQSATIAYTVADEKLEFTRDDKVGMAYRVSVVANATEDELKTVFDKVVIDDGFDMHEVWFYSDERLTDGSAAFDVALASNSFTDGEVTVTMASEESKEAAKVLLAEKTANQESSASAEGGEESQ